MIKKSWPRISKTENHGNPAFLVDSRIAGKGERRFFPSRNEAEAFAQVCRIRRQNEGASVFDDRELATYGWTVQQAIRFSIEHLRKQQGSIPLPEAIERLITAKLASNKSEYYCRLMRQRLEKLLSHFKGRKIGEITASEIERFLAALNLAPATKNTVRRDMVTLWSYAVKTGLAQSNEAQKVDTSETMDSAPAIFTPKQAGDLLAESLGDVLVFHAIGLFAGLRVSEIKRLDWQDVDFLGGYVHVAAAKSKTRSRRLVPILDALRSWVEPIAKPSGAIIERNFSKRQLATRQAAGITEWPGNGLRHSFVS